MNYKPVQPNERIIFLDILRGIAILFIFIANAYTFSGWYDLPEEIKSQFSGARLNSVIKQLTVIFIDGKWYSVFSILFGIGFVIQFENARKNNKPFVSFFLRRMLGLLFFGLIHLFFLWFGDILTLYALIGFGLILFRNLSNKKLLIWAGILLTLPTIHILLMVSFNFFYPEILFQKALAYLSENNIPFIMEEGRFDYYDYAQTRLDGNSWKQFFLLNFVMPLIRLYGLLYEGRIFKVLACFLIGIWAGRKILHHGLLQNRNLLKKITLYGFLIGIPMNILWAYGQVQSQEVWRLINYISYAVGVVPLACGYAATVALLLNSGHKYLSIFAPVGQMAMSNYIFQTIISIAIFYGIGFGLALDTTLWQVILLVIIVFIIQILFSYIWLKNFKYGPLEWVWRMMTYKKYIPNKK